MEVSEFIKFFAVFDKTAGLLSLLCEFERFTSSQRIQVMYKYGFAKMY